MNNIDLEEQIDDVKFRKQLEQEYEIISQRIESLMTEIKKYEALQQKITEALETQIPEIIQSENLNISGSDRWVEKVHLRKGTYIARIDTSEGVRFRCRISNTGSYYVSLNSPKDIFQIERTGNYFVKVSAMKEWSITFELQM